MPSFLILGLALLAAVILTWTRTSPAEHSPQRVAASNALGIATIVQSVHFAEEWMADFHIHFPALFSLDPMPITVFVAFNVAWIAIWITAAVTIRSRSRVAFVAAWFLAIAGTLNGLAHPIMALASNGYFPGLISSPFIGAAGIYLWVRLAQATTNLAR